MRKGAVFDVDGTLLDSMPIWEDAGARFLAGLGIKAEENLGEIMFRMSLDEGAAYLKKTYNLDMTEERVKKGILGVINDFYVRNLVELPKKNDNLAVRVAFCDDPDEKAVMYVSDFRDLGYLYLMQIGENIVACAECGVLMRGNKAGTKKYCSHCAGYIPQEFKIITCVDCGKEFRVNSKNHKTVRCQDCQAIKDRERKRLWKANKVDATNKS